MTREEDIKARLGQSHYNRVIHVGDAIDDIRYLLARNEELQRENEKMQAVVDAAKELVEVATLRGDNDLPHPCNDPLLWTARMQDAWNWIGDALTDLDTKEQNDDD